MWILGQQKEKKNLVIDSDIGNENETLGGGECSFSSTEGWIKDIISW